MKCEAKGISSICFREDCVRTNFKPPSLSIRRFVLVLFPNPRETLRTSTIVGRTSGIGKRWGDSALCPGLSAPLRDRLDPM